MLVYVLLVYTNRYVYIYILLVYIITLLRVASRCARQEGSAALRGPPRDVCVCVCVILVI